MAKQEKTTEAKGNRQRTEILNLNLSGSVPTESLQLLAGCEDVFLRSRGKRGGVLNIEILTNKEACDLAALLRHAARKTSGKPLAATSEGGNPLRQMTTTRATPCRESRKGGAR